MTTYKEIISIKKELKGSKDIYIRYLERVIKILLKYNTRRNPLIKVKEYIDNGFSSCRGQNISKGVK